MCRDHRDAYLESEARDTECRSLFRTQSDSSWHSARSSPRLLEHFHDPRTE